MRYDAGELDAKLDPGFHRTTNCCQGAPLGRREHAL
jgi:hypothetical protein